MGDVPRLIEAAFYSGARSDGVPFVVNDPVRVVGGPHAGQAGSVISIVAMGPEVTLLIEFGDSGNDARVPVDQLRLHEPTE